MRYKAISVLVTGMLLSAPAVAREKAQRGDDERSTVGSLERQDEALQRRAAVRNVGAVERSRISQQRREIRDLIERLESGQSVSPSEVDRALGQ